MPVKCKDCGYVDHNKWGGPTGLHLSDSGNPTCSRCGSKNVYHYEESKVSNIHFIPKKVKCRDCGHVGLSANFPPALSIDGSKSQAIPACVNCKSGNITRVEE